MRRVLPPVLAALAALAGSFPDARACSCLPIDFYGAVARSDAVFLGEVLQITPIEDDLFLRVSVHVRVEASWKGQPPPEAAVITAMYDASCGYPFRIGRRYLIYATHSSDPGAQAEFSTHLCSRTHETWPEDPDIQLLGAPLPVLTLTAAPNPFRGTALLTWSVLDDFGGEAQVRLEVLDSQGRRVRTIVNDRFPAGTYWSSWNGEDERGARTVAGIYWVRLALGDHVATRPLVRITSNP